MGYKNMVNRFSMTRAGNWFARTLIAPIDPLIYKLTGGRLTAAGPQVIPQIVLTCTGRKSGKRRTVQVAYVKDGDDFIVVASNFGRGNHPGWAYNLQANPEATVQHGSETYAVRATRVSDDEKEALWPKLDADVPQFKAYRAQTDRNIRIFRLRPE